MNWKWIFEKGMFWILILTFFIGNYFSGQEIQGVNKTVGWTFDQSNQWIINGFIVFGSWLIFLIGYGIVALMRKKTDLKLSIVHLAIFILTLTIGVVNDLFGIGVLIISLISILVFGLNIYRTLKNKKLEIITK
ncbi:hypothetical protein C7H62_0489 [Mesoflavibacter sp. HG96]|uniref:hypothetical protein n=1 Tax=unclassified Mesoflavibacter TaxID=2630131 RepID=UPI000D10E8A5|nr:MULTISPECIES: hypothetical protein [unclassified Mesoflavibacter]QIJ88298.1 hypothetical protein C7H62_0489 [Mesoflavibacter sp. HG96]QIJ91026.1 hypothetical protein C7H56_0489 [Mesoflavibacter sp. HG37]